MIADCIQFFASLTVSHARATGRPLHGLPAHRLDYSSQLRSRSPREGWLSGLIAAWRQTIAHCSREPCFGYRLARQALVAFGRTARGWAF